MPGVNAPVGSMTRPSRTAFSILNFLYFEGGEHARDDDPDKGVRHPAPGADAPPKAECVVDGRGDARVDVGIGEALRFEGERIGEKPVIV